MNKLGWVFTIIILIGLAFCAYYNSTGIFASTEDVVKIQKTIEQEPIPENELEERIASLSNYIQLRKTVTPKEVADKIAYEIITQSDLNYIADDIVVGIIEIESMWNIYAKSKAGAKGLMQILIEDGVEILPEKAHDISYNIEKGIAIFKSKLKKADGDITLALKYYVGGDPDYHKAVYKYLGKYTLYKINHSTPEIIKKIKIMRN